MKNIKSIKVSSDFLIEFDNSSLKKFKYTQSKDKYIVDISDLSLLDATKIAVLSSTYCLLNDFSKKLCWIVKDKEIKKAMSVLRLKNIDQIFVNDEENRKLVIA